VMSEATLSVRNQIVIPREAREAAIRGLGRGLYPAGYLQKERENWD